MGNLGKVRKSLGVNPALLCKTPIVLFPCIEAELAAKKKPGLVLKNAIALNDPKLYDNCFEVLKKHGYLEGMPDIIT